MLYLLTSTVVRWSDACALRREDLDNESGVIRVQRAQYKGAVTDFTKSGNAKKVPLTEEIQQPFAAHPPTLVDQGAASGPSSWMDLLDLGHQGQQERGAGRRAA